MRRWQEWDANVRFRELLQMCLGRRPRTVALTVRPTLKELLLADSPRVDLPPLPRGQKRSAAEPL